MYVTQVNFKDCSLIFPIYIFIQKKLRFKSLNLEGCHMMKGMKNKLNYIFSRMGHVLSSILDVFIYQLWTAF